MSIMSSRRPWLRRPIGILIAAGVLAGAVVAARAVAQRGAGDGSSALAQAEWRGAVLGFDDGFAALHASETRDPGFADRREAFVRGAGLRAVQVALPGVTLGEVECRATTCRLTFAAPDDVSAHLLAGAPWGTLRASSISYAASITVTVTALMVEEPDAAVVAWFGQVTPEFALHEFVRTGRTDQASLALVAAWARGAGRR